MTGVVLLTEQTPSSVDVSVTLDDRSPTAIWNDLFAPNGLRVPFIRAAQESADGRTVLELYDDLQELGVPPFLATRIRDIGRGNEQTAFRTACAVSNLPDSRGIEDAVAAAQLFGHVDETPSVGVCIEPAFFDRRRGQRKTICRVLDVLADGADVTIYGSPIELRRLATEHRSDLTGVSEYLNRDRDSTSVSAAFERLGRDGRPVEILRQLAEEPGETATVSTLYATATVSKSRVRQVLSTLSEVGCIATYGPQQDRRVELTSTGREFLSETSRQLTLKSAVSETTQHQQQSRVNPSGVEEGGQDGRPYRTAYLDRSSTTAAAACGVEGTVTVVEDSHYPDPGNRVRYVSYIEDCDKAVIAIRASTSLQYAVSLATALASPEFFDRALPVSRLEDIEEPAEILRGARCIGGVSKAAENDGQVLRDTLVEWGNELADMTTELQAGEYNDRDSFRADIMRSAHGLAGSVVHLLDAAGVSLTREVRIPDRLAREQLQELATTMSYSLAIQSKYESFAAFRQLYESREEKRQAAFSVNVDAANPAGSLIGSVVIRSGAADRVGEALGDAVRHRLELVEDAPEFAVSIPIRRGGRQAYRRLAGRFGGQKRLDMTDSAVRILRALTASPYAAADALHELGTESLTREIRPDELRYALSTLPAGRLADVPPTARQMLSALLGAKEPLSQAALADAAGVSTSSVRRHIDTLTALGIAADTEAGYRCSLSFSDDRGADVETIEQFGRATDALDAVLSSTLPPDRYADSGDNLASAVHWPPDPWRVLDDPPPELAGWIGVSRVLAEPCRNPKSVENDCKTVSTVELGEATAQTPVTALARSSTR